MEFYETRNPLKTAFYVIAGTAVLATAVGIANYKKKEEPKPEPQIKEIYNFGTGRYQTAKYSSRGDQVLANPAVALGDMDGDGDLDVIIVNELGDLTILENNLPQKNKQGE